MSDISATNWPADAGGAGRRAAAAAPRAVRPQVIARVVWATLKAAAALAVLTTAAVVSVAALRSLPAQAPASSAPPPPVWEDINKPVQIYSLESPLLAGVAGYAARRHRGGGGREDVLTRGTIGDGQPALRLAMFRRADEAPETLPLFAALVHEAARLGFAVTHAGLPDLMPTRFGAFEFADVALAREDAAPLPCTGFRLVRDAPALTITGLACGKADAAPSKATVGCLVERLDVAAARDDRALTDFFAASELKRNAACAGMRLAPDGAHAAWLDEPAPAAPKPAVAPRPDTSATSRKSLRHRKGFAVTLAGR